MSESHTLLFDHQHEPAHRAEFFRCTEEIFEGFSFREWAALGGWSPRYRTASLFEGSRMVSNASISRLEVIIDGRIVPAAQFATVGTLPTHRRRGLGTRLMHAWLERLEGETEFQFLFADENAFAFYRACGFRRVEESRFRAWVAWPAAVVRPRTLDIRNATDRTLIMDLLTRRQPVTNVFGCLDYGYVVLFHLLHRPGRCLHFFDASEVLVIARQEGDVLHVHDIASPRPIEAGAWLRRVPVARVREVVFHFTPDQVDLTAEAGPLPDSSLFVRGPFPLEGRPFKFPVLAQT